MNKLCAGFHFSQVVATSSHAGETVQGPLNNYLRMYSKNIAVADGRVWLVPPEGTKCFAGRTGAEGRVGDPLRARRRFI
jgi:hypothetical protein